MSACFKLFASARYLPGADVESTFYKCCQEGNMWAASASSCDSLAKKALASVVSEEHRTSCEITIDICCRATMRERFCDAGKAAARSNKGCETPDDQCPGDTYKVLPPPLPFGPTSSFIFRRPRDFFFG